MYDMMKKQNFGVEVEFTGISRRMAAKALAEVLESTEITSPDNSCYKRIKVTDGKGRKWTIMRDGSIHQQRKAGSDPIEEYSVEFVTPILKYEDLDLLQSIVRKFRELGAIANDSCGIHVHVDGANHTAASLRNLLIFFGNRQDIVYDALDIGVRKDSWCKPICADLLNAVKKSRNLSTDDLKRIWYSEYNDGYSAGINTEQHYNTTRYHALNLHSFFSKGTVEFRLFNSTLHAGKIKAYVQFCLAVSAWSISANKTPSFRKTEHYNADQKAMLMYHILTNRFGLTGDEFNTCRLHLLANLKKAAGQIAA